MAQTFADRLRELREAAGVSQYRLAQLAGLSKQTLSRLESGKVQPTWDTVQSLARALGVEVTTFVTEGGRPVDVPPVKKAGRPRKPPAEPKPARKPRKGK